MPIGIFLSSGVDSSLIASITKSVTKKKINTFSLGVLQNNDYNELKAAENISKHLNSNHYSFEIKEKEIIENIENALNKFDEPFADSSQILMNILCKKSKNHIKVALTGDGGDELFGGYNHYHRSSQIWSNVNKIPRFIRKTLSLILHPVGELFYETSVGRKIERLSNYLLCDSLFDCYNIQILASNLELKKLLNFDVRATPLRKKNNLSDFEAMMVADINCYLPDDILAKVDRASMSVSLETRAPFLDHSIVDFSYRLPLNQKIKNGSGKLILKNLLEKYMPRELFERPKMGFGLPIDEWLRGPLKNWAESMLSTESLEEIGFFNINFIMLKN